MVVIRSIQDPALDHQHARPVWKTAMHAIRSRLMARCDDQQDAGAGPAFAWNDLLPELREIILDKVPLLCLAQLATLCKEFRAAYRKRQEGQKRVEALLPCPLVQPLDPGFWVGMPLGFYEPEMIERCWWVSPRFHGGFQWGSSLSPLQGMHITLWSVRPGLCSKVATSTVKGCYMARECLEPCSATVGLRSVLVTGFRRRWVVGTELLLDCSDARP